MHPNKASKGVRILQTSIKTYGLDDKGTSQKVSAAIPFAPNKRFFPLQALLSRYMIFFA
jgi:hypothetical protein